MSANIMWLNKCAPSVTTSRKRFVLIGCSHGQYLHRGAEQELHQFCSGFKPHLRVHLGDFLDTTAWRSGAPGTPDSGSSIRADFDSGLDFLDRWEPNLVFLGNHDWRPFENTQHPDARVRHAAETCCKEIEGFARDHKFGLVPYHIENGWRMLGNRVIGHGFMYSTTYLRDHVFYLQHSIAIAHLHVVETVQTRTINGLDGTCVGFLADKQLMTYAHKRPSYSRWKIGWAFGEYSDTDCHLNTYVAKCQSAPAIAPVPGCGNVAGQVEVSA